MAGIPYRSAPWPGLFPAVRCGSSWGSSFVQPFPEPGHDPLSLAAMGFAVGAFAPALDREAYRPVIEPFGLGEGVKAEIPALVQKRFQGLYGLHGLGRLSVHHGP